MTMSVIHPGSYMILRIYGIYRWFIFYVIPSRLTCFPLILLDSCDSGDVLAVDISSMLK